MERVERIVPLLRLLHEEIARRGNQLLRENDLTLAQGHLVGYLAHCEGGRAPLKELEKVLHVAQSTTVGLVSRLEKKGFLRTYSDASDKRVKIVELTEQAHTFLPNMRRAFQEIDDELFASLSPAEKAMLIEMLRKIHDDLQLSVGISHKTSGENAQ